MRVECCNFVDAGTSILLSAQVRNDFRAETAFDAVITVMQQYGRPGSFRLDRDPRWIGGQMMRDFPSALLRTRLGLGVEPVICPPKRPDKNPFVERYNRSYKYECILVHRPGTLQEAQEVTQAYQEHYNWQRPRSVSAPARISRLASPFLSGPACLSCRRRWTQMPGWLTCMAVPISAILIRGAT